MNKSTLNFTTLVEVIQRAHGELAANASRAVNVSLTVRNWLIGYNIAEYELNGTDRAVYGKNLLSELANALEEQQIRNCNRRQLYDYINFYRAYPKIVKALPVQFQTLLYGRIKERIQKVPTLSAQFDVPPDQLLNQLSYSMFRLLVEIDDHTKRAFYENECIKGNWSVRELKRQIDSLYYERSNLSFNKDKLSSLTHNTAEKNKSSLEIRDPYVFEFLGLTPQEVMNESHLEEQLINKIEGFILELGQGFCFEARQKRILIGGEHFFVDLVFYNRILKCHILIEIKLKEFTHENIGQLNTYVSWFKKNMMTEGDNPPIGILLCTKKNHALVEYALADMENNLFVSKYMLELPKKEEIQKFVEEELEKAGYDL